MPHLTTDDSVKLYYEDSGSGIPIVFVHELAGDYRSWEPQVRYFARGYRCITYNARGYPPSDVPAEAERYSQDRARDDIRAVLDALKIDKAHIVGLSMGGSRRSISASPTRSVRVRWSSLGAAMEPRPTSVSSSQRKRRRRQEGSRRPASLRRPRFTRSGRRACSSKLQTRAAG